jgi:purine-binding chemotaxis protein CheW
MTRSDRAAMVGAADPTPQRWLLLRVADEVLALPADDVLEIADAQPITRLPGAPRSVPGIVNHRGTVIPAIDLGLARGGGRSAVAGHRLVVVRWRGAGIGLVVDDAIALRERLDSHPVPAVTELVLDPLLDPLF